MSVPMKAEAKVSVSTGDYTIAYPMRAIAAIQGQRPGKSINQVLQGLQEDSEHQIDDLMLVLWAGLQKHHPMSEDDMQDIVMMPELGVWMQGVSQAMVAGQPEVKGAANPRKAAKPR